MQQWLKFGAFLSRRLTVLVICGLVVGVAFPDLLTPLRPAVPFLFALMTFQNSLSISVESLKDAVKHPLPILLTILFSHAVAPVIAYLIGTLVFGYNPDIVAGIVLEYTTPAAASAIMWVGLYGGNVSISLATMLVSSVIAPFTMPASLQLLLGATVHVDAVNMLLDLVIMVGIPAALGLGFNELSHGWGKAKLSPVMAPFSRVCVPIIVATNSTRISSYVLHLTPELAAVLVFILIFAICNFFMGFGLAKLTRQPDETFYSMTFGCGMRNITAGAIVAAQYFPPETIFPVLAGTFFQQLLASIFGPLTRKLVER